MSELVKFIENKMRMSHIYQPVMIKILLEEGGGKSGVANKKQIPCFASFFLIILRLELVIIHNQVSPNQSSQSFQPSFRYAISG